MVEHVVIVERTYPGLPGIGTVCYVRPKPNREGECLLIVLHSPEIGYSTSARHFVMRSRVLEAAQVDGALRALSPVEIMVMRLPHPDAIPWVFQPRR